MKAPLDQLDFEVNSTGDRNGNVHYRPVTAALKSKHYDRLKKLSEKTRVPMQEYMREGIDLVLEKHL